MKTLLAIAIGIACACSAEIGVAADGAITVSSSGATDQPAPPPEPDPWITRKVEARLLMTKDIPSADINVTTSDGIVTLSGFVETKAQIDESVGVTRAVKGVRNVISSALAARN